VSAIGREGTREVCLKVQHFFDEQKYTAMQDAADLDARAQAMREKVAREQATETPAAMGNADDDSAASDAS
jgi:hypothetical protein